MPTPLRKSGIGFLGDIAWGAHFCHFYETKNDLLATLVPYFSAGLEAKELCVWLVAKPLTPRDARSALRRAVPELERHIADGSIEIRSGPDWHLRDGVIDIETMTAFWDAKLELAMDRGFAGLRVSGSPAALCRRDRGAFLEYEEKVNRSMSGKRMLALCSFPLASSGAAHILDVARAHQFALAKRQGRRDVVETPGLRQAKEEIDERRRAEEELRARNRQLSAVAGLGQTAIRAQDLTALLNEAAAIVAATLGTEYSAVAEKLPDTEDFLVRAGIGWNAGVVGGTFTAGDAPDTVYMLRSDEPVVIADVRAESRFAIAPGLVEHGIRSAIAVVIRGRSRPWGLLGVYTTGPRAFSPDDVGFLQSVSNLLAMAVERNEVEVAQARLLESETRARAEAEAALDRLRAIDTITDGALVHLSLDELLRELVVRLRRALDADSAGVLLLDDDGQTLYPRAVDGLAHQNASSIRVRVGAGVTGRIAAEGRPLIVDDHSTVDLSGIEGVAHADVRATTRSVMGAPLRIGDKVVGVVMVVSVRPRRFTEEELKLLLLVAGRAAPAVERAQLLEKVRAGRERQNALSRRLLTAQEEERRRLAVELHDELGQVLTAVKINLQSLERASRAAPAPAHLKDAIASVDHAMQRVRDLALDLRPSVLDDLGLPAALRWYVDRFARDARVETHVSVDSVPHLEPELETACFRVAQEALTNVARHAQARRVWLDLHLLGEGLELKVRDDGIGFDAGAARERASAGTSMGLLGMQERVSLVGGGFAVESLPGGGTSVRARFAVGEKAPRKA